jgi:hypothetical protein
MLGTGDKGGFVGSQKCHQIRDLGRVSDPPQGNLREGVSAALVGRGNLARAIFDYRMHQMEDRRGEMLAAAKGAGTLQDARTLFEVVFLPQLVLQDANGKHSYANFLAQYLLRNQSTKFGDFGSPLPPHLKQTLKLLRRRLHYLPQSTAQRRPVSASFMFLTTLVPARSNEVRRGGGREL